MSDEKPHLQVDSKYWDQRVNLFGHTGWSNASLYAYDQRLRISRILELVDIAHDAVVLDFGCGIGELTYSLAIEYPKAQFLGMDISELAIDLAESRLVGMPNVRFKVGQIDDDGLESCKFDLILCVTVLQHIEPSNLATVIDNMARLLRPNGKIIVLENVYRLSGMGSYINTAFDERGWCDIADSVGLKTEFRTYYPHWGVVLIELTLPFLRDAISRCRNLISVTSKSDQISPGRNVKISRASLIIVRILLAITWMFDYVLKFPMPPSCRRYAIFIMSKRNKVCSG